MTTAVRCNHLSHWKMTTKPRIKDPLVLFAFIRSHSWQPSDNIQVHAGTLPHRTRGDKRLSAGASHNLEKAFKKERDKSRALTTWHRTRTYHLSLDDLCLGTHSQKWLKTTQDPRAPLPQHRILFSSQIPALTKPTEISVLNIFCVSATRHKRTAAVISAPRESTAR